MEKIIWTVFGSLILFSVFTVVTNDVSYKAGRYVEATAASYGVRPGEKASEATEAPETAPAPLPVAQELRSGDASWYDYTWEGETTRPCYIDREPCYTEDKLVAAARDFERYSWVRVRRLDTGATVDVKITDYGPDGDLFPERIIDLSSWAFQQIAQLHEGVVRVSVTPIEK